MNTMSRNRNVIFNFIIELEPRTKLYGTEMNDCNTFSLANLSHTLIKNNTVRPINKYHKYLNMNAPSYFDYNVIARVLGIPIDSHPERLHCFSYNKRKNETNRFSVFLYFCGNQKVLPLSEKRGYMAIYSSYIPIIVERTSSIGELHIVNVIYVGNVSYITPHTGTWKGRPHYEYRSGVKVTNETENQLGLSIENIIENSRDSIIENDRLLYRIMFNEELPIDSQ